MIKKEFNLILIESIDEVLNALGESTKKLIIYHSRRIYQAEERETNEDPMILIYDIRKFFGEVGSTFLESRIIETLYAKMGQIAPSTLKFEADVKNAEKLYSKIKQCTTKNVRSYVEI